MPNRIKCPMTDQCALRQTNQTKKNHLVNSQNRKMIIFIVMRFIYCQQTTFLVGDKPIGLAFSKNGDLFVANYGSNSVSKIVPSTNDVDNVYITRLNSAYFIAFDSMDNMYVSNGQQISKFNGRGLKEAMFGGAALSSITPTGLAFDFNDNLYLHDFIYGRILKIGSSNISTLATRVSVGEFVGLSFDAAGESLYVPNVTANSIVKIRVADGNVTVLRGDFVSPTDVVVDCVGNMYVSNRDGNSVSKVFANGSVALLVEGQLDSPRGIALDSNGSLYVCNYGGKSVTKINPLRIEDAHGPRFGDIGCPSVLTTRKPATTTTKILSTTTMTSSSVTTNLQPLTASSITTIRSPPAVTSSPTSLSSVTAKESTTMHALTTLVDTLASSDATAISTASLQRNLSSTIDETTSDQQPTLTNLARITNSSVIVGDSMSNMTTVITVSIIVGLLLLAAAAVIVALYFIRSRSRQNQPKIIVASLKGNAVARQNAKVDQQYGQTSLANDLG